MDNGFPILMLIFSGALYLYALLLALTKDVQLIPRQSSARIPNPKAYALRFAGIMALVAFVPLAAGVAGLIYDDRRTLIVLIAGLVFSLWGATQLIKKVMPPEPEEREEVPEEMPPEASPEVVVVSPGLPPQAEEVPAAPPAAPEEASAAGEASQTWPPQDF